MRLIGLGHPRSGTAYFSKRASDYGLKVGHEKMGLDGISSWLWTAKQKEVPWGPGFAPPQEGTIDLPIYILRDPIPLIGSVYYTEGASVEWRASMLNRESKELDGPNGAAISCLDWIELSKERWGDRIQFVRLDELDAFFETLTQSKANKKGSPTNMRKRPDLTPRLREIKDIFLKEMESIYASFEERAREAALQWHYITNPDHHTFIDKQKFIKLFRAMGIPTKGPILDAGCGKGAAGLLLKNLGFEKVVGFDYCLERVEAARAAGGYHSILHMDIFDVGKIALSFPIVLCCEVLEHLENPKRVVEIIRRTSHIVGTVPIKHPYHAHLQVFDSDKDVEKKLGVTVMFNDGKRAWFFGESKRK